MKKFSSPGKNHPIMFGPNAGNFYKGLIFSFHKIKRSSLFLVRGDWEGSWDLHPISGDFIESSLSWIQ